MARTLMLMVEHVSDDAVRLIELLRDRGYEAIPRIPYVTPSETSEHLSRSRAEARMAEAILLLAQTDGREFTRNVLGELERLQVGTLGPRIISLVLPGLTQIAAKGAVIRLAALTASEIDKVVAAIESELKDSQPLLPGNAEPSFAVVWDPNTLDAASYAKLISAIGDLARAVGAVGIRRVDACQMPRLAAAGAER